jgi:UDP-glucose 4-epimerase
MISWVIGRGGLLGRSVESALADQGPIWHPQERFTWKDPHAVGEELTAACRDFRAEIGNSPWQIAWCAGSGVVGSQSWELEQETGAFARLLEAMSEHLCGKNNAPGALFLASSAGGVYAGVGTPPFSECSPVAPLAPYGWNKLDQESMARLWSKETATPLLIGRLSNLYGPGQNISKSQGLISQICLRVLARQPLILYVPLDTMRDYLFATDAGRLVADGLTRLHQESLRSQTTPAVVKIMASHQPATVASVLAQFRWITKRPASVIFAVSSNTQRQARDLRMMSTVWPELDRHPVTTLSEGMRWVLTSILRVAGQDGIFDRAPLGP